VYRNYCAGAIIAASESKIFEDGGSIDAEGHSTVVCYRSALLFSGSVPD